MGVAGVSGASAGGTGGAPPGADGPIGLPCLSTSTKLNRLDCQISFSLAADAAVIAGPVGIDDPAGNVGERPVEQRVRNGFMLNPPADKKVSYDSGVRNWFHPELIRKLPVSMIPGDSLVSTISMPNGLILVTELGRNKDTRGDEDASPTRTAAVLTCVDAPLPPDAFRPAFFRGEVLNRDTPTLVPEDLGAEVGMFRIDESPPEPPA